MREPRGGSRCRGLAPSLAAALAALSAVGARAEPAAAPETSTEIEATLDPGGARIAGHARLRVVNDGPAPLAAVELWLYPNALADRSPALGDVSFHWLYPGGFSPAGIEIGGAKVAGVPVAAAIRDTPLGARTLASLPLAAPLAPGEAATVDVDFETRLPRRYGAFGCDGVRCRLMGGFYPVPVSSGGTGALAVPGARAVARAGRTRVALRLPAGLALVLDGQPIARRDDAPVVVDSADVAYPTIVTDRVLRPATLAVGDHVVRYLHRRPRPPPSDELLLPYTREDIPGLVLATAGRALEFADLFLGRLQALPPGVRDLPLTLVEAPLRHELCQAHGDVILVSDQIFGIFPVDRVRKYHRLEIVRAVLTAVVDARLAATEAPADRERAVGMLAAYLTELFASSAFDRVEYAADLLRPFDFVPAVDQLIYAPLLASSSSYFGDVEDADRVRDGLPRLAARGPTPRFVYNKLLDLLGPDAFAGLARAMLGRREPLRPAAAAAFGAELGWFWTQWLGPLPRVNYRLASVAATPRAGGSHLVVEVSREGDLVREPVEVLVEDRAGGRHTLRWDDGAAGHRFEIDLPAGPKAVEIDPRGRLVETAVGSLRPSDDPRYDNRDPARWRTIYEGFGALVNVTQITANFAAALLFKPQHDLRHQILASVFHSETAVLGIRADYGWNFGAQADKNSLTSSLSGGLGVSRIDPSFGLLVGQRPEPGWRLSARAGLSHDTRDYLFDPWRAVGLAVGVGAAVTALADGERLSQASAGAEALRLFELHPGHVLGLDAQAGATSGDIRLATQLLAAGGPAAMRGYLADELLSRANAIATVQLRDDYVTGLDWNLLHFTTVRGFAGTLFADAAAISTCDGYGFARDRLYADAGYSFRVLHDAFGVYQQLLSIDFAVPLNRHDPYTTCLGHPVAAHARPSFNVLVSFFPSF
jgi:hypothetical protein